jgi:hypothetical protein
MSKLLFCDSFDHYTAGDQRIPAGIYRKWTSAADLMRTVPGRTGMCLKDTASGRFLNVMKGLEVRQTMLTIGTAINWETFNGGGGVRFDGFTVAGTGFSLSCQTLTNPTADKGKLAISYSSTLVKTAFILQLNRWYYLEFQVNMIVNQTTRAVRYISSARLDGVEVLTSDFTTANNVGDIGQAFSQFTVSGSGGLMIDDLYLTDTEFLGDVHIAAIYPNAVGDLSGWTPNAAGDNYTKVKEPIADDLTTYVSTPTVGATDLYNFDPLDAAYTGVIKGVQANVCLTKTSPGSCAVKNQWKSGGVQVERPEAFHPSYAATTARSWLFYLEQYRKSPFTGLDWGIAEINALQLGLRRVQ